MARRHYEILKLGTVFVLADEEFDTPTSTINHLAIALDSRSESLRRGFRFYCISLVFSRPISSFDSEHFQKFHDSFATEKLESLANGMVSFVSASPEIIKTTAMLVLWDA